MVEVKTDWTKTFIAYVTGIPYVFLKLFLPAYFILSFFENIIIFLFAVRITDIGYILRNTVCQGPDLSTNIKYLCMNYIQGHKEVADIFIKDFKELVVNSIAKYPVLYIHTNNFVYKNILLPLQDEGVLELETLSGYKVPQVIEKVQIMDWYSVARCIWDKKVRQQLFRIESVFKYRLKRVDTYV
ncbi:hypothetical protein [Tepidanaerobacter acetatoxydans]|uniref:hypothetical protein n=1 Tax=Tepidanaerobacter acetatoxydans TaxID=499229 RepID=UPI001BD21EEA|nr:hypothetical protein [Tepidanaerobacter acetatoxydans]